MIKHTLVLAALLAASSAYAVDVATVTWDPVDDQRVGVYEVHVGPAPSTYAHTVSAEVPTTTVTIPDLGIDNYYMAVRACKVDLSLCSEFSNEVSFDRPIGVPGNFQITVTVNVNIQQP